MVVQENVKREREGAREKKKSLEEVSEKVNL